MNFNTDGFNERSNYIHNSNDLNMLKKNGPSKFDSSFAKMKVEENKPDINTVNNDKIFVNEEVRGNRDNFVLRTNHINNVSMNHSTDNPVSRALNRNMFKR